MLRALLVTAAWAARINQEFAEVEGEAGAADIHAHSQQMSELGAPKVVVPLVPEMMDSDRVPAGLTADPAVAIYVRCENLHSREAFSDTDSRARVQYYYASSSGQELLQISKTEVVENVGSPAYAKPLKVLRPTPLPQVLLNFSIYDQSGDKDYLRLGSFTADLTALTSKVKAAKSRSVEFSLCRRGVSEGLKDGLVGCAGGEKDEAKRARTPSRCTVSGFDTWTQHSKMQLQIFAMDLPNKGKQVLSAKVKREMELKGQPLPVTTEPYLQIFGSKSVDRPCRITDKEQIMWSRMTGTQSRPAGVLDKACVGPISMETSKEGPVPGRSTEAGHSQRYISWKPFSVDVDELCGGEWEREVSLVVWDDGGNQAGKKDYMIGGLSVPCKAFKDMSMLNGFGNLSQVDFQGSQGFLMLNSTQWVQQVTAAEYVASGVEVKVTFAVDFSQSNILQPAGDRETIMSGGLHALKDGTPNDYESVLSNVAEVLGQFDTDGKMPLWTFGGLHNTASGKNDSVHVTAGRSAEGIVAGYRAEVQNCMDGSWPKYKVPPGWSDGEVKGWCFGGPDGARYAPMISKAAREARMDKSSSYHVLVVLTDGDETHFSKFGHAGSDEVVQALRNASRSSPLSVIFVGIGSERSDGLKKLRGLEKQVCSQKDSYRRDILDVLFLQDLREKHRKATAISDKMKRTNAYIAKRRLSGVKTNKAVKNVLTVEEELARTVLDELPEHLLTYFSDFRSILPKHALTTFMSSDDLQRASRMASAPLVLERRGYKLAAGRKSDLCLPGAETPPMTLRLTDVRPTAVYSSQPAAPVYSPLSDKRIAGDYVLESKQRVNGFPVWKQGSNYLYSDISGYWMIGSDVQGNRGWLSTAKAHGGRLPHKDHEWSYKHTSVVDATPITHFKPCVSQQWTSIEEAKRSCSKLTACKGFDFSGTPSWPGKKYMMHFYNRTGLRRMKGMTSYYVRPASPDDRAMSLDVLQEAMAGKMRGEASASLLGPKSASACHESRMAAYRAIKVCIVPDLKGSCPP